MYTYIVNWPQRSQADAPDTHANPESTNLLILLPSLAEQGGVPSLRIFMCVYTIYMYTYILYVYGSVLVHSHTSCIGFLRFYSQLIDGSIRLVYSSKLHEYTTVC